MKTAPKTVIRWGCFLLLMGGWLIAQRPHLHDLPWVVGIAIVAAAGFAWLSRTR